jgi:hypothetical protein
MKDFCTWGRALALPDAREDIRDDGASEWHS